MTSMAAAINDKSSSTGVTATIDDAGDLIMSDSDGDDIKITNVAINGGVDGGTMILVQIMLVQVKRYLRLLRVQ